MSFIHKILFLTALVCLETAAYPNGGIKRLSKDWESRSSQCRPFSSTLSSASVEQDKPSNGLERSINAPFIAVSPQDSYQTSIDGLHMFLRRPQGTITTDDGVNSATAEGATINSTFTILYGKVTFEVQAPAVAGVVTAAILIADQHDEIDVELLGGDSRHWQTNVYAPSPKDTQPLWGVFGEIHDVGGSSTVSAFHNYTIDWKEDHISWSVDGRIVRTLEPAQTIINGTTHYPIHPSRIQLGIWDASSPIGTSEWAKGPIDWQKAPEVLTAIVKSVVVECS